jgi:hypothetical protein
MTKFERADFERLARELRAYADEYSIAAQGDHLRRAADAFDQFLEGGSLDEAFGQKKQRGRPKTELPGKHYDIAERAFYLRGKLSWKDICGTLEIEDQREFQRICEREWPKVARSLAKQLAARPYPNKA